MNSPEIPHLPPKLAAEIAAKYAPQPLTPEEQLLQRLGLIQEEITRQHTGSILVDGFIRDPKELSSRLSVAYFESLSTWHKDDLLKILSAFLTVDTIERLRNQ